MRQRDIIRIWSPETPTQVMLRIVSEVAAEHFVFQHEILSVERLRDDVAFARFHAWHRLRTEHNYTLPRIARMFKRDHTTIMHGLRRYAEAGPHGVRRRRAA
jgi:chromosomal replication initiation ATPase DnaA